MVVLFYNYTLNMNSNLFSLEMDLFKMFYVYRFINSLNQVIYVGKTKEELQKRFKAHKHLPDECYKSVRKIEYVICQSESDMSIKEIYYINKFSHEGHISYNLLDVSVPSQVIGIEDEWIIYKGFLPIWFSSSINVVRGYKETKETKYNLDGSIKKTAPNRKSGVRYDVLPLDENDINRVIMLYIDRINSATNGEDKQISLRNLIIFMTGIQFPKKLKDLLQLQYKDIFNSSNRVKPLKLISNRSFKDYELTFELDDSLKKLYGYYRKKYNLSFSKNSEDYLFITREHNLLSSTTYNYIIKDIVKGAKINKNVGGETLRKTYGQHIFNICPDKIRALDYLEIVIGQKGLGEIAKYLCILDREFDYSVFQTSKYKYAQIDICSLLA